MTTAMASRMKLTFPFQRQRSANDEYTTSSQQISARSEGSTSFSEGQDQHRRASTRAAHDFIYDLIKLNDRWSSHMPLIRIDCPHTLHELHALGNLPQAEGVVACCKLVRVPVIHEEIGVFLWMQLASLARGPNFADSLAIEATEDVCTQRSDEASFAQIDQRFRFDSPASFSARGRRRRDSPPMSPTEMPQRSLTGSTSSSELRQRARPALASLPCPQESIEECDEGLQDTRSEALGPMRGRVASHASSGPPAAIRPGSERQRSFFSNASRSGSHVSTLRWYREHGTPKTASRASSMSRKRSGSLAGRLGSAVGGLGHRFIGALGEGLSNGYGNRPRSRSRSARSL